MEAAKALVRLLITQKKLADAVEILTSTLPPAVLQLPSSVPLLEARLDLLGRQRHWKEAAADARRILDHQPGDHARYHSLAPLLAITRDWPAYQELSRRMLDRFGNATNAYVADRVAKVCLLVPQTGVDLQQIDRLTDMALVAGHKDVSLPLFQMCKALSQLRLGDYEKAIEWADKSFRSSFVNSKAQAFAIQAMALWHLGRKDEARAALAHGNLLAPGMVSTDDDPKNLERWATRLLARIQLEEADALIQSGAPSDNGAKQP